MYKEYWKLTRLPFENLPDPQFFYSSRGHQEAVMRLLFAIQSRKMISLITGDYGSGKTVLCQTVMDRLSSNEHKIAFLTNPRMSATDLTREIASQLGEDIASDSKYDVLRSFRHLLDRHAVAGRHCTAIIDEAQLINDISVLEDIRLLLNYQTSVRTSLSLVLVGQTEFNDMLNAVPQMKQRISLKFHIPQLEPDELKPYMKFRLEAAGSDLSIFDDAAVADLAKLSRCNPREINALADMCLLIGFFARKPKITSDIVNEAAKERM